MADKEVTDKKIEKNDKKTKKKSSKKIKNPALKLKNLKRFKICLYVCKIISEIDVEGKSKTVWKHPSILVASPKELLAYDGTVHLAALIKIKKILI